VGKSAVLDIMRQLGAHTIDADKVAHEVMQPGGLAYDEVVATFGPEILREDGSIDRQHLANIVFTSPEKLAQLEAIVHPAVERAVQTEIAAADAPVVVIEAIKLLEGRLKSVCDEIWVVTAPEDVQLARLMQQRGMSEEQAHGRMSAQSSQEWKASQADVVIVNDRDLEALAEQVTAAWRALEQNLNESRQISGKLPSADSRRHNNLDSPLITMKKLWNEHPNLTSFVILALGMLIILYFSARHVGFTPSQWLALAAATVALAGLSVWIISWGEDDALDDETSV